MGANWLLVQISVVVAAIQTRYMRARSGQNTLCVREAALKSVVERGSLRVALKQGWVGPKCPVKTNKKSHDRHERELG